MAKSTKEKLAMRGIKLTLTDNGIDTLARIIADGCPITFDYKKMEPICCPANNYTTVNTCVNCWTRFLKSVATKEE